MDYCPKMIKTAGFIPAALFLLTLAAGSFALAEEKQGAIVLAAAGACMVDSSKLDQIKVKCLQWCGDEYQGSDAGASNRRGACQKACGKFRLYVTQSSASLCK